MTNDNGGTAVPTAWTLSAAGPTPISGTTGSAAVTNGAGERGHLHAVRVGGPAGYTPRRVDVHRRHPDRRVVVWPTGQVGDLHDQQRRHQPAQLTLVKTVTNDNGGTAVPTAWTLAAAGPTPITGATGSRAVTNAPVNAGTYTLSRVRRAGRLHGGRLVVHGGHADRVDSVLPLGAVATCTINNNDQPAQSDAGQDGDQRQRRHRGADRVDVGRGRADADLRGDRVAGGDQRAGQRGHLHAVRVGGPAGYTAGAWSCTAGTLTGSQSCVVPGGDVDLHDQQQRPAGAADAGEDGDQRQRRHRGADRVDVDGDRSDADQRGDRAAPVTDAPVNAGTYTLSESGGPAG